MKKALFMFIYPLLLVFSAHVMGHSMERKMVTESTQTVLTARQYALAEIAALTASGEVNMLAPAINRALDDGMTVNEIKDEMVQLYAYCGFPRSLNALTALNTTIEKRRRQKLSVTEGRTATPLPAGTDMLQQGTATQTELVGTPVHIALSADIDRYLKTHLFGDIFASDLLSYQEREMATVAALASMHGVDAQLNAHFNMSRHTGVSNAQLEAILDIVMHYQRELGKQAKQLLQHNIAA